MTTIAVTSSRRAEILNDSHSASRLATAVKPEAKRDRFIYLVIGYMWLFIHRPFEVWPTLGEMLRMQLCCAIAIAICWICYPKKVWTASLLNIAFLAFFVVMLLSCVAGRYTELGLVVIDNWYKCAFVYIVIVSTVRDESQLRLIVKGFLISTALYMAHSLREFQAGRHEYRMGIVRMIGVDAYLSDPNSFAATLLYAVPMSFPFWQDAPGVFSRLLQVGYWALTLTCVLLTGSRGAFVGLGFLTISRAFLSRHLLKSVVFLVLASPVLWFVLPERLQNRFLTLYDPSYGPANAQESAESRAQFFEEGLRLFQNEPLLGNGPDSFPLASGTLMKPHNLYAQLLSELGGLGALCFCLILLGFFLNHWKIKQLSQGRPDSFPLMVSRSVMVGIAVLLVLGMGAHNLFRYQWLWFGAFQVAALRSLQTSREEGA